MQRPLDFVGIGAPKSGTTWLGSCMAEHPEIYMPRKEFKYFDRKYNKNLKGLEEHFKDVPENLKIGEYTPRYFIDYTALRRIKHHFPNIKLLMLIRDPVERAISQYTFYVYNLKRENKYSLKEALNGVQKMSYIEKGLYAKHLKIVYSLFPKENVHIDLYQNIKLTPKEVLKKVYNFLEVDTNFSPSVLDKKIHYSKKNTKIPPYFLLTMNKALKNPTYLSSIPRVGVKAMRMGYKILSPAFEKINLLKPVDKLLIDEETKSLLYNHYFKSDIEELEELTGFELADWKKY